MAGQGRQVQDIESLRGISIALVMIAHLPFLMPWPQLVFDYTSQLRFGAGVDLFFVVSGYVITMSLFRELDHGRLPAKTLLYHFWIKRFFRLIPPAVLVIGVTLVVVALVGETSIFSIHGGFSQASWGAFASLTEWMNIWAYIQVVNERPYTLLAHFWSLSLEEQFYLLWPIAVVALRRRNTLLLLSSALLIVYSFSDRDGVTDFAWWFRIDGLCWGTIIYLTADRWKRLEMSRPAALIFLASGLVALLGATSLFGSSPFSQSLMTLGAALCVFIAALDRDFLQGRGRVKLVINYLGSRSYTIYLWHILIFSGLQLAWVTFLPDMVATFSVLSAGLILVSLIPFLSVIELSYSFVERHGRRIGRRLVDRLRYSHVSGKISA
ncbi:acyltransferase family protein [Aliiruegeria lutimaris]|uniref:Peptidoglycan/LPS O-acetylase OafA/YrhL, contains acyltransferase and SGNH-hydrolase domains n=1 Tax=Aliiruegeria lutimaris TaxID=571298 RepID=A0A1G8UP14_9RHOB|nr:acyltransferase [Aliiruegeria lutimaris]SDJ55543.1 Peptidoglycan/LPS O-acetylase OafA/YrhL, contains acyltransferase and SGNH-hydrolase domains [Aliiruegeria lutimaris]